MKTNQSIAALGAGLTLMFASNLDQITMDKQPKATLKKQQSTEETVRNVVKWLPFRTGKLAIEFYEDYSKSSAPTQNEQLKLK